MASRLIHLDKLEKSLHFRKHAMAMTPRILLAVVVQWVS